MTVVFVFGDMLDDEAPLWARDAVLVDLAEDEVPVEEEPPEVWLPGTTCVVVVALCVFLSVSEGVGVGVVGASVVEEESVGVGVLTVF